MTEQCKATDVFVKINEEDLALVEVFNALGNEIRLEIVKMLEAAQRSIKSDGWLEEIT